MVIFMKKKFDEPAKAAREDISTLLDVHVRTVQRRLHEAGLPSFKASHKPFLTKENARNQLQWGRAHQRFPSWQRVIFY